MAPANILRADVVHDDVMDAPAGSQLGWRSALSISGEGCGQNNAAAGMEDVRVSDGHVRDLTDRTDVAFSWSVLVLGSQKYGMARLAETSPDVLHQIVLGQHTHGILEFHVVLDNKRIAFAPTLKRRVPRHPLPGLEEVIEMDGDVGRSRRRCCTAEHNGFARGFQEVVFDFIRTILVVPRTAAHRVRVRT